MSFVMCCVFWNFVVEVEFVGRNRIPISLEL
jgi:hypothetical protein